MNPVWDTLQPTPSLHAKLPAHPLLTLNLAFLFPYLHQLSQILIRWNRLLQLQLGWIQHTRCNIMELYLTLWISLDMFSSMEIHSQVMFLSILIVELLHLWTHQLIQDMKIISLILDQLRMFFRLDPSSQLWSMDTNLKS